MYLPGKPIKPTLMFARPEPTSVEQLSCAPKGRLLYLPTNIKVVWKGLTDKYSNSLQTFVNYVRKSFYDIGPSSSGALVEPGNTKGGSITIPLTSCLTSLESVVRQLTIFVFICNTD